MKIGFVGFVAIVISGCCEPGSGVVVQESRQVGSFDRLALSVPATVSLAVGGPAGLKIRTDDNLIGHITTSTDDGELRIETDDHCCIDPTVLEVQVSAATLSAIRIDGAGDIDIEGPLEVAALELGIDGAGSITALELDVATLSSSIDGAGEIELAGAAREHDISIDGAGELDAPGLVTSVTRVEIDGVGECDVFASERLEVDIDGAGEVSYCGSPAVSEDIDGVGDVSSGDC